MSDKRSRTISYAAKSISGGKSASSQSSVPAKPVSSFNNALVGPKPPYLPHTAASTSQVRQKVTQATQPSTSKAPDNKLSTAPTKSPVYTYINGVPRPSGASASFAKVDEHLGQPPSTSQMRQKVTQATHHSTSKAPDNKPSTATPKLPVYTYINGVRQPGASASFAKLDEHVGQPKVIFVPADQCLKTQKSIKAPSTKQGVSQTSKTNPVKRLAQPSKPMGSKKVEKAPAKTVKASSKTATAPAKKTKKTKEAKIADALNEDPNVFTVEKVINKKVKNGKIYYRIRWQGYGPEDDTWEPVDECSCDDAIRLYESTHGTVTLLSSAGKKSSKVTSKKPTYVPRKKKSTGKKGSEGGKDLGTGTNSGSTAESSVPWCVLDQRTLKVVPQLFRTRLDNGQLPGKILDRVNPPLDSDDGCQRYLCEWDDGVTCWLPGKLCCKIIPKLVCSFMLSSLLSEPDTINFLTS